jgi:hypothetical protein
MSPKDITTRHNPKETEELDSIIRNSYDDFVRIERRNLLIASSTILIAWFSDLNPSKGTIFGFSFNSLSVESFYLIVLIVNFYFLVAFLIYAMPSYRNVNKMRKSIIEKSGTLQYQGHRFSLELPNLKNNTQYYTWVAVYFYLPVGLGVLASLAGVLKIV